MAKYFVEDTTLVNIADNIRSLTGSSESMSPSQMATEIQEAESNIDEAMSALEALGVEVPEGADIRDLATLIASIDIGGSETEGFSKDLIDFIAGNMTTGEFNSEQIAALGRGAFATTSITSISLPNCVKIDAYAFYSCRSLTTAYLPKCENLIGTGTFMYCSVLTSMDLPLCRGISTYAFNACSNLATVNLPMCSLISYNNFMSCSNLTSVSIPQCKYIGTSAFAKCYKLPSITLPSVCSRIYSQAFGYCSNLTKLVLEYPSVVTLSNINAFSCSPMVDASYTGSFGSIYVPASLVDVYKSATNWTAYAERITAIT